MDYPPREVLRVPDRMPALPPGIDPLKQEVLGLLTEGESMSGEHLHHSVSYTFRSCLFVMQTWQFHVWFRVAGEPVKEGSVSW